MPDIEIYTQPGCPYCARALHLLAGKGVAFREVEAPLGSEARREASRRAGGSGTVPQIFIGGRHIGGSDDLAALDGSGELDRLLAA